MKQRGWFAAARKLYAEDILKKRERRKLVSQGVWRLEWWSKDGRKTMEITLDGQHMPLNESMKIYHRPKHQSQRGAAVLRVWSPDRAATDKHGNGWRSFNVNDEISLTPKA